MSEDDERQAAYEERAMELAAIRAMLEELLLRMAGQREFANIAAAIEVYFDHNLD